MPCGKVATLRFRAGSLLDRNHGAAIFTCSPIRVEVLFAELKMRISERCQNAIPRIAKAVIGMRHSLWLCKSRWSLISSSSYPTRAKVIILICGDLAMARERSSGSSKGSLIQRPFTGGFMAENNGEVDEFYRAAISAGARDNISPRARLEYYPGYYAADIFDPDGYSFEVVHKSSRG